MSMGDQQDRRLTMRHSLCRPGMSAEACESLSPGFGTVSGTRLETVKVVGRAHARARASTGTSTTTNCCRTTTTAGTLDYNITHSHKRIGPRSHRMFETYAGRGLDFSRTRTMLATRDFSCIGFYASRGRRTDGRMDRHQTRGRCFTLCVIDRAHRNTMNL